VPDDPIKPSSFDSPDANLERLTLALDGSNDGIWDWDIPSNMLWHSDRSQLLYGLEIGASTRPLEAWVQAVKLHPDDIPNVFIFAESFKSGEPPYEGHWRALHPDGKYRWISVRGRVVKNADGVAVRAAGSISDIDGLMQAQAALLESEKRFSLAVAGSQDGIWDWRLEDNQMFLSPRCQEIYDIESGAEVQSRDIWNACIRLHPDDVEAACSTEQKCLDGEPSFDGKWRVLTRDGSERWIRVRGICERDAQGRARRLAGSVTDIDAQVRAEAKLAMAQRLEATGILAGGIAHDFNNILAAILGFGEVIHRDSKPDSQLRRDVENILLAGERGKSLVGKILAFSRNSTAAKEPVQVQLVVQETLKLLAATLPSDIELMADLNGGQASILGETTQVHQIVMNLATNAVQAMKGGGRLKVSLTLEESAAQEQESQAIGHVLLKVEDTGGGIAPHILDKIFDPFFTTKSASGGSGLGLSLVHGLVQDLGGSVSVSSVIAQGATFTVRLPRCDDARTEPTAPFSVLRPGSGERVLVVDDEEPLVELMQTLLRRLGYEPDCYTSSIEALVAFTQAPGSFDIVITDERMPDVSGSELVQKIRALRQDIPVLLISGNPPPAGDDPLSEPDTVLRKPISMSQLAERVAELLR